jgi:hypothetical protein
MGIYCLTFDQPGPGNFQTTSDIDYAVENSIDPDYPLSV